MEDRIFELLSAYDVYRQGSVGEYKDLFITLWENESYDTKHYDNVRSGIVFSYDINVYGKSPNTVYQTLRDVIDILEGDGFIITGEGHDVPSDDANYIGRGINIKYRKKEG